MTRLENYTFLTPGFTGSRPNDYAGIQGLVVTGFSNSTFQAGGSITQGARLVRNGVVRNSGDSVSSISQAQEEKAQTESLLLLAIPARLPPQERQDGTFSCLSELRDVLPAVLLPSTDAPTPESLLRLPNH